MKIGYARVSTVDQNLNLQLDALKKAGCERIFEDKISGAKDSRPGLDDMLGFARSGDQIVVWKLDRLGRTMKQLVSLVNELKEKGINIEVIQGGIDTTTPTGMMMFHLFGTFAELEREMIRERTNAGLEAARARGNFGGRKPVLSEDRARHVATLVKSEPDRTVPYWCKQFGISKSTFYRSVQPLIDER